MLMSALGLAQAVYLLWFNESGKKLSFWAKLLLFITIPGIFSRIGWVAGKADPASECFDRGGIVLDGRCTAVNLSQN